MSVALQGRDENGQERLEPLAADPVGRFPEHDDRLPHRVIVDRETRTSVPSVRERRRIEQSNGVLAVVAGHRHELIQNAEFLFLQAASVSFPNRLQQILAGLRVDRPCHRASLGLPQW